MTNEPKAALPGAQLDAQISALQADVADLKARVTALENAEPVEPPIEPPVEPPPTETGSMPLSWDDPRFTGMTEKTGTDYKGSQTKISVTNGSVQTAAFVTSNGNTLETCRAKANEGIRATGGTQTYSNVFLDITGKAGDHADGIQTYSPGSRGTLVLRNSTVKMATSNATAGLFVADNWTGKIDVRDCCFIGGPYAVRIYPDIGGDNEIFFRNVFFVGPFGYDAMAFDDVGGHKNIIREWTNVCEATIQNGKLVPGKAIPPPKAVTP